MAKLCSHLRQNRVSVITYLLYCCPRAHARSLRTHLLEISEHWYDSSGGSCRTSGCVCVMTRLLPDIHRETDPKSSALEVVGD